MLIVTAKMPKRKLTLGMAAAALLVFWNYRRVADRQFGGLSGDLAGWFLQRCELGMLGALVFCQLLEGKLG